MKTVRVLLLTGVSLAVAYIILFRPKIPGLNTSDLQKNINPSLQKLNSIPIPKDVKSILSSTSNLPTLNVPNVDDLKILAQDLPKVIAQDLPTQVIEMAPKIQDIVTNSQREELYLKAPKAVVLNFSATTNDQSSQNLSNSCLLNTSGRDSQITFSLPSFEIKDTRKSNTRWTLTINLSDLVGNNGRISQDELKISLNRSQITVLDGKAEELQISNGPRLKVWAADGQGKGHFLLTPQVTMASTNQTNFSGPYTAQITATFE